MGDHDWFADDFSRRNLDVKRGAQFGVHFGENIEIGGGDRRAQFCGALRRWLLDAKCAQIEFVDSAVSPDFFGRRREAFGPWGKVGGH